MTIPLVLSLPPPTGKAQRVHRPVEAARPTLSTERGSVLDLALVSKRHASHYTINK